MPGRYIYLNRYAGSTAALLNIAPADQGADGDVERIGFWPSTKWEGMRVMPQLLQTIYEIAVEKGRDVLCIVFGDPRVPPPYYEGLNVLNDELIEWPDWRTHPTRQQVVDWLKINGIAYRKTGFPQEGWIIEGYGGSLYLDVPFDTSNPEYQKLAAFLEDPDGSPRLPGMTFWAVSLESAHRHLKEISHSGD